MLQRGFRIVCVSPKHADPEPTPEEQASVDMLPDEDQAVSDDEPIEEPKPTKAALWSRAKALGLVDGESYRHVTIDALQALLDDRTHDVLEQLTDG